MKILICGANGMLGSELEKRLKKSHEVLGLGKRELDICNKAMIKSAFNGFKPEVVINCSAMTNVDLCESERELAWKVNAWGCRNLAIVSEKLGCRLISFSTDYVFNGKKDRPYHEFDVADGGETIYGQTKFAGEQLIAQNCKNYLIARVSWLYGENGKNFVDTMLSLAKNKLSEIKVVNDQIGNPTSTNSVAVAVEGLLDRPDYRGIVHLTSEGEASWYAFAKEIFKMKGITQKVIPCTSLEFPRPAKRPSNSRLEKRVLELLDLPPMPEWRLELSNYLTSKEKS